MRINIIVAVSDNGIIGDDNTLLWDIPEDMKMFKYLTTGKSVIMGRKTHESIGKALPNRQNVVLTRDMNYNGLGDISVANSIESALDVCESNDIFVIGGAQVYKLFEDICDRVYLSRVHKDYNGDSEFVMNLDDFELYDSKLIKSKEVDFTFMEYNRKVVIDQ